MKYCTKLAAVLLSAAGAFPLPASPSEGSVRLHVVALDDAGKPVSSLTASDFAVFDNGARQQIVSCKLQQTGAPPPLVILFDLMNANLNSRGAIWNYLKTSLTNSPPAGPVYLYLLVADGSLYPVRALPGAEVAPEMSDQPWSAGIASLLDKAMHQVSQLKPHEIEVSPLARFQATFRALDDLRVRMDALPGPKELLWATYGVRSAIRLVGHGWWDGAPVLRGLGARFVRSDVTVYTADPATNLDRGMLNRDSLDILTGATGGRTFAVSLDREIAQIETEAQASYSIEYQPPAGNWDGKYHKLRVTPVRKGIRLRTENGYLAAGS